MGSEYGDHGDFDHVRDLSVNSVVFSPEQLGIGLEREAARSAQSRTKDDAAVLSELISSMSDYLESARQRERGGVDALNDGAVGGDRVSEERAKQYVERSHFSVGKRVDVLDISYQWYTATIIDVDVMSQRAVLIQYDHFDAIWNEWIPLQKSYRVSPHRARTAVGVSTPSLRSERGGVHALVATKYGRSKHAKDLRAAFESDFESEPRGCLRAHDLWKWSQFFKVSQFLKFEVLKSEFMAPTHSLIC